MHDFKKILFQEFPWLSLTQLVEDSTVFELLAVKHLL